MNEKHTLLHERDCPGQCQQVEVPSEEEVAALNEMRSIRNYARDLKKRLSEISPSANQADAGEVNRLEAELKQLKEEWQRWKQKKEDAAKKRMILLGHIDP